MSASPLQSHQRRPDGAKHRRGFAAEGAATAAEAARSTLQFSAGQGPSEEFGKVSLFRPILISWRIFIPKFELGCLLRKAREIKMQVVRSLLDVVNGADTIRFDEDRHDEVLIAPGNQEIHPAIFLFRPVTTISKFMAVWVRYVSEGDRKLAVFCRPNQSTAIGLLLQFSEMFRHTDRLLIAHPSSPLQLITIRQTCDV